MPYREKEMEDYLFYFFCLVVLLEDEGAVCGASIKLYG